MFNSIRRTLKPINPKKNIYFFTWRISNFSPAGRRAILGSRDKKTGDTERLHCRPLKTDIWMQFNWGSGLIVCERGWSDSEVGEGKSRVCETWEWTTITPWIRPLRLLPVWERRRPALVTVCDQRPLLLWKWRETRLWQGRSEESRGIIFSSKKKSHPKPTAYLQD